MRIAGAFPFRAGRGEETPAQMAIYEKAFLSDKNVGLNSCRSVLLTEVIQTSTKTGMAVVVL